ncbi:MULTISPECIES: ferrochelatase [Deefgea]|uniref:Ferrochelatase n=1 Tax=Deefgea chitinilytica TaxID=570276 RepID=A0ABS2C852_9NEIS|nr:MULTISPECIES: ferrochelatase [Deefgea]MBM5570324.1 ferrochelatase [Deefgea chitinilytica]MBM9887553.1 ferrochelatase [Deefgea sp. CFH1-16]
MARFFIEPAFSHQNPAKIGVLLVNLGTPEAPTAAAVRPYLRQFLSDPRVVEIPKPIWWLILNGIILTVRPKKSAEKYASIWSKEGSPLKVWTEKQAKLVKGLLGESFPGQLVVDYAMRYGKPSIESQIAKLKAANCQKIIIVPLYPQYAASTSASVNDEVYRVLQKTRFQPAIRTVAPFFDHPEYIAALEQQVRQHWQSNGRGDHLLLSFHGVPRYTLNKGDPYHCHALKTGRLLAEALQLKPEQYTVAFQSRFGKAEWLKPYTSQVITELGKKQVGQLDVFCPGFVADCLETLEEIAIEGQHDFVSAGGKKYNFIPCLNDNPRWISTLETLIKTELTGWLTNGKADIRNNSELNQSLDKAKALGAVN